MKDIVEESFPATAELKICNISLFVILKIVLPVNTCKTTCVCERDSI